MSRIPATISFTNAQQAKEKPMLTQTENQRLMVSSQFRVKKEFISDELKRIMSALTKKEQKNAKERKKQ